MHTAFAADERYALPLAVAVRSLIEHFSRHLELMVHVFCLGLAEDTKRLLNSSWPEWVEVRFYDIDEEWLNTLPLVGDLRMIPYADRSMYVRLLIPDLIPEGVAQKILYLDVDTLTLADVTPLLDITLDGIPVAAVRDTWLAGDLALVGRGDELQVEPSEGKGYFNSGVMLMNLDVWRKEELGRSALCYLQDSAEDIKLPDQDALNACVAGRWVELEPSWNTMVSEWQRVQAIRPLTRSTTPPTQSGWDTLGQDELLSRARILHFVGRYKPWMSVFRCQVYKVLYQRYERLTLRQQRTARAHSSMLHQENYANANRIVTPPRRAFVRKKAPKIVYLTRGHGYSHADTDVKVIEELQLRCPDADLTVASSGMGVEYYRTRSSIPCLDLGIPDDSDQSADAVKRVSHFLADMGAADLVVSHEVFSVPLVCDKLGLRNLLLTEWFWSEIGTPRLDRLFRYADGVILLDFEEAHTVPLDVGTPVHFTGPMAERFPTTRVQARQSLGVGERDFVVVGSFGSMGAMLSKKFEDTKTLLYTILQAWSKNADGPREKLYLLAERREQLGFKEYHSRSVHWVGITEMPDMYYRAADLVFTYASSRTVRELARNAVPTVGVIGSVSPVDRVRADFLERHRLLQFAEMNVGPDDLWRLGQRALHQKARAQEVAPQLLWGEPGRVSELILSYLPQNTET